MLSDFGGSGLPGFEGVIGAQGPGGVDVSDVNEPGVGDGVGLETKDPGDFGAVFRIKARAGREGDCGDRRWIVQAKGIPSVFSEGHLASFYPAKETRRGTGGEVEGASGQGDFCSCPFLRPDPQGMCSGGRRLDGVDKLVCVEEGGHRLAHDIGVVGKRGPERWRESLQDASSLRGVNICWPDAKM